MKKLLYVIFFAPALTASDPASKKQNLTSPSARFYHHFHRIEPRLPFAARRATSHLAHLAVQFERVKPTPKPKAKL